MNEALHPEPLGLYVHIPFCSAICNYCNFNRGLFDSSLKSEYVEQLLVEIARAAPDGSRPAVDTIYFGGGTPSLLDPSDVARVIATCEQVFDVAPDREITLEANPETVTASRLAGFRAAGVNRLSLGVQSFRDEELKRLRRLHNAQRARLAFAEARSAGFDNVSLDLMMWLPGQDVEQWCESVDAAIVLGPEHLSLYMLEVYANAPLRDEMERARWSLAPDDDAAAMYLSGLERLDAAGYTQYEISNVARSRRWARHNLKYWTDGEWLGLGSGAHSTRAGVRWKNVSGTEEYIRRIRGAASVVVDARKLSAAERLGDALFTGLRLTAGVDLGSMLVRYGVDVWGRFGPSLEPFVAEGCLLREGKWLRLTRRGMLLANEIMAVFV